MASTNKRPGRAGRIMVGTAGWGVPSRHAAICPGDGSHLQRYARVLDCAEINSSFYRPHRRATYEKWAAATPDGFRFSVKAPKTLTHDQRLAPPYDALDRFAEEIAGLGGKLGAVLVQTPPKLEFDAGAADGFFAALAARIAAPIVFEPRHSTWFTQETDAWLAARRIARAAADPAKPEGAGEPGGWRGLTYVRLHGSPKMYWSSYDDAFLAALAARAPLYAASGPVWCVFDNTGGSQALANAAALRRLLQ